MQKKETKSTKRVEKTQANRRISFGVSANGKYQMANVNNVIVTEVGILFMFSCQTAAMAAVYIGIINCVIDNVKTVFFSFSFL